jgi:hypothetical protein
MNLGLGLGLLTIISTLLTGCLTVGVSYDQDGTQFSAGYSDGKTVLSATQGSKTLNLKYKKP